MKGGVAAARRMQVWPERPSGWAKSIYAPSAARHNLRAGERDRVQAHWLGGQKLELLRSVVREMPRRAGEDPTSIAEPSRVQDPEAELRRRA
jgi:hypothetical protein